MQIRHCTDMVYLLIIIFFSLPVHAEVITDGTVGNAQQLTGPDYQITQDLGTTSGTNLFHSFQQFNLSAGESATFSGDAGIQNIFSRVTGGSQSMIDGTIASTIPGANLYMINPSGILFGENARLNIGGSFYATTADSVSLGNDGRFDATQPAQSILSSSPPTAFGFLDADIGAINVTQSELTVPEGQTLALIGGDITIDGNDVEEDTTMFNDIATIETGPFELHAPSGNVSLISVAGAATVTMNSGTIDVSGAAALGDINIINKAYVTTKGDPGGTVFIRGGEIFISESVVDSATMGEQHHPGSGIDIGATILTLESVANEQSTVGGASAIQASTFGGGNAGAVNINADSITLEGNIDYFTNIATRSFAGGTSGQLNIDANDISLGDAGIMNQVYGSGAGSDTEINAQSISLVNNAIITADSGSSAQGGDLNITTGSLTISDSYRNYFSGVMARSYANGASGDININAQLIDMSNYGQIQNMPYGYGATSGDINISTVDLTINEAAAIHNNTFFTFLGYAGDINITAKNISITGTQSPTQSPFVYDATGIKAGTYYGSSGDLTINATNITLDNRAIIQNSDFQAGEVGNTTINFDTLNILGGSQIAGGTFGAFDGGGITLTGQTLVISGVHPDPFSETPVENSPQLLSNSTIASQSGINGGSAGNVVIDVGSLSVTDGGRITTATYGPGDAADIIINADRVEVSGQNQVYFDFIQENELQDASRANSLLTSATYGFFLGDGATGGAGDIIINAQSMSLADSATITSASFSPGRGGDINLNVNALRISGGASIDSNASRGGDGGSIGIVSDEIAISENSSVNAASSAQGFSGNISMSARRLVLEDSAVQTSAQVSDGGDVNFQVADFFSIQDSRITTEVNSGSGNGGNISIDPQLLFINRSQISANAAGGNGGNINIVANNLIVSPDSSITATSILGIDGDILIQSPNLDVTGELQGLSRPALNPEDFFRNPCTAGDHFSRFRVTKKSTVNQQADADNSAQVQDQYSIDQTTKLQQLKDKPVKVHLAKIDKNDCGL